MKELTKESFGEFIASDEKVLVDFWAPWCGPCKSMLPLLERAEQQQPSKIAKVNVDENTDLAAQFGIRSIPTLIVFQKSMVMERKVGAPKNVDEIVSLVS
jgi:thioredoxin 1